VDEMAVRFFDLKVAVRELFFCLYGSQLRSNHALLVFGGTEVWSECSSWQTIYNLISLAVGKIPV